MRNGDDGGEDCEHLVSTYEDSHDQRCDDACAHAYESCLCACFWILCSTVHATVSGVVASVHSQEQPKATRDSWAVARGIRAHEPL